MAEPSVSVVVAAGEDAAGLALCLETLAAQAADGTEVIVVSSAPCPAETRERFPGMAWLDARRPLPVPGLWGLGIERADRDVVATTTGHFTPAPDWVQVIRRSHARLGSPAIGGPIDPPREGGLVEWATYFTRYSAYARGEREESRHDLAADNASYKRAALLAHRELLRDGFWEQDFHRRFLRAGATLTFVPEMRVRLRSASGFRRFLRERFQHGRRFGRARLQGRGTAARVLHVLASPLVPAILLARISSRMLRGGRHLGRFAAAFPVLTCFVLAWSAGEAAGYASGAPGSGGGA
jgi:hypothetical protein